MRCLRWLSCPRSSEEGNVNWLWQLGLLDDVCYYALSYVVPALHSDTSLCIIRPATRTPYAPWQRILYMRLIRTSRVFVFYSVFVKDMTSSTPCTSILHDKSGLYVSPILSCIVGELDRVHAPIFPQEAPEGTGVQSAPLAGIPMCKGVVQRELLQCLPGSAEPEY